MHSYTSVELLFSFHTQYLQADKQFEDGLQGIAVANSAEYWMKNEYSVQETVYIVWLSVLNEIWDRSVERHLGHQWYLVESQERNEKKFSKKDLILLRWLGQDNQKGHKMEFRWEGSYVLSKIAKHEMSRWLQNIHMCEVKGWYHINNMKLFILWKEHETKNNKWMKVADLNKKLWRKLAFRKKSLPLEKSDKARKAENLINTFDILYWSDGMMYLIGFRDKGWDYWRGHTINLQELCESRELWALSKRGGGNTDEGGPQRH